jgi:Ser/Thr protein kinase RdoA (MazF antagonist)
VQPRLGDVHHDHILFTGDTVTGVVDFGATDFDSPAGDVARLLGSMVGDDCERWRQGLAAYQAIRPMTPGETAAVKFFDTSGTVVSAANWIGWLWPGQTDVVHRIDRPTGVHRLGQLVVRLRALAGAATDRTTPADGHDTA